MATIKKPTPYRTTVDEPPPYTDGPSSPGLTPPSDAQKAQAPLKIQRTNEAIKGAFNIVDISTAKSPPDVFLSTTNAKISTTLWVEGGLPRLFEIEAATTNAQISLSVNTISPTQPISITATTTNSQRATLSGQLHIALPAAFHGILTISSGSNNNHSLSAGLKDRSVLISPEDPALENAATYQINGPDGESRAVLKTTNSSIKVGLTTDKMAEAGGGCVVM